LGGGQVQRENTDRGRESNGKISNVEKETGGVGEESGDQEVMATLNEDKLIPKKKVNIELEVDTNLTDSSKNRYQTLIDLAKAIDSWRIFPRIFITTYIFLLYKVVIWYMDLASPTMEQSGLVSIVVGAGAAWFGLYTGSRAKSSK
jgi:hypothetical protein